MAISQTSESRLLAAGIQPERLYALNDRPVRAGAYVLYWMQAAQRADDNHALEYALRRANELNLPLVAGFGLAAAYPEAGARQYEFMLRGLAETAGELAARGIGLVLRRGEPPEVAAELSRDAALTVVDAGYSQLQHQWRGLAAQQAPCALIQVEGEAVVPVETASDHEEYAARTLRPRLWRQLPRFLVPLRAGKLRRGSLAWAARLGGEKIADWPRLLAGLKLAEAPPALPDRPSGPRAARRRLREFLARGGLERYAAERDDPNRPGTSELSPYLHFGQIGPLTIALAAVKRGAGPEHPFLEQLLVRRELALNFAYYSPNCLNYDQALPDWTRRTLARHARDRREYVYDFAAFQAAETHDPYWNAAQRQLLREGTIHNYPRMYWGKKILEWSPSPRLAWEWALRLNDRLALDGRDPNGWAGVAWCLGKHDRPWPERPVYGTVRSMGIGGLKRKFDLEAYARRYAAVAAKTVFP